MQRVGRIGAAFVGITCAVVLVGWYSGVAVLTTVLPGYPAMKPNSALALGAVAVAVVAMGRRRWAVSLGAFATLVASATLLEYLLGLSLGVDVLLPGIDLGGDTPRMAPATALALLLLGSAIIAEGRDRTTLMRCLALGAWCVGQVGILGYAYGVSSLYTVGGVTSMALPSALCVQLLSVSILVLDPSAGLVSLFADRGSAGRLVRLMVPFVVLGPFLLGWLRLWAQDQGWFDPRLGTSFLVMGMTILAGALTWRTTVSLRDLDRQRDAAVQSLAEANETLEAAVTERTREITRRTSFLDALLETVEVGIVSCDAEGNTLLLNRAKRVMVGLDGAAAGLWADDNAPKIVFLKLDGRPLTAGQYPLVRALDGEDVAAELLLGPPGGPYREVVVRGDRITGPDAEVLGAVVAVTDVTVERSVARALAAERAHLEEAQRLGQLGSFEYDFDSKSWSFSDQLCALWGVGPGGLVHEVTQSLIHDQDREQTSQSWQSASSLGGRHSWDFRIHRADDGAERLIRSNVEIGLGADGLPRTGYGTHMDITELTRAQETAKEANSFLEAVLAATPDYTFVTDLPSGAVLYGSPGKKILGMTGEEFKALGTDVMSLIHPEDVPRLLATNVASADLGPGQVLQLLYRAKQPDEQWRWLSRRVTPFRRDTSGSVVEVLGVMRDVTDVVQAEDHLRHAGLHDSLTDLPNRALLVDRLDAALARSGRDGREVAVLYLDLDGFKRVNDAAGHAAGDAVLVETARRLLGVIRPADTAARVGGDEFVVVIEPWDRTAPARRPDEPALGLESVRDLALHVAERIASAVSQPIEVNGVEHIVTASIGIAFAMASPGGRAETVTSNEVLQDADAAMYQAKGRGKDRFEVFEHGLRTDLAERGRVEQVLRQILRLSGKPSGSAGGQTPPEAVPMLDVAYQPVFCSTSGALVSFEALARLTDANGVDIPPEVFVKVAEEIGMIRPLGTLILELACAQLASWRAGTPGLEKVTMAVNLSAIQAQHPSLIAEVQHALAAHHLLAPDLVLELTETALLHAAHSTINALRALRAEGVGIAIDDFGVGYASLRYLATLPVTGVKVDRSFVAGLPHDEISRKIVKAVAGLAADMDLTCVIEGVEFDAQRKALPPGVQLQGFLTGPPELPHQLDLLSLVTFGAPNLCRDDAMG